jgi:hypothetical protein
MTNKPLRPGGEVDAWCTKCRLDLLHRIIAMRGDKIERVECRTCNGHHNYHRPKSGPALPARTNGASSSSRSAAPRAPSSPSARALAAAAIEKARVTGWEKRVLGQPLGSFKLYRPTQRFEAGELIRHAKFGEGYIASIIDKQKVEVMFREGPRTLAQGLDS